MPDEAKNSVTSNKVSRIRGLVKPERILWLATLLVLVLTFFGVQTNLTSAIEEISQNQVSRMTEISRLEAELESAKEKIASTAELADSALACGDLVPPLEEEIRELESNLSTISLSTQSMWNNGWRGINREQFNSAVENFSEIADSTVVQDGRGKCVSE